jgi:hypothetical protein
MKEEFLHYLWKYRLYDHDSLSESVGHRILVLNPGEYNRNSGPDFFNARIIIGDTEWAGNVEIHTRASHFNTHGHNIDRAFDNIILHVVSEKDQPVYNTKGEEILTVEIRYNNSLYEKYLDLVNNPKIVACENETDVLDTAFMDHWFHYLLIERLEDKSSAIKKILNKTGNDWDETFYRILSRYFGFRVNTEPFEMLATATPFKIIRKHSDSRFQIEALLFGTAGMLEEGLFRDAVNDTYYRDLIKEYRILSAKYSLKPIHGWLWKFSRLRPVNFPTIRISQLAGLLSVAGGLFSQTLEAEKTGQLKKLLEVTASSYWDDHYIFGKKSSYSLKKTGAQAIDIFLINAVIPLIFTYGRFHDNPEICEKSLTFLKDIVPEENSVIRDWKSAGINAETAYQSQALLQLTDHYCKKRKCLECRIGSTLISMGRDLIKQDKLLLEPKARIVRTL